MILVLIWHAHSLTSNIAYIRSEVVFSLPQKLNYRWRIKICTRLGGKRNFNGIELQNNSLAD